MDNAGPATSARVQSAHASDGMMSPALAQALFNMALMPLLNSGGDDEQRQNDPLTALNAYARMNSELASRAIAASMAGSRFAR